MSDAPGEDDPTTRPQIQRETGMDDGTESGSDVKSLQPPTSGQEDGVTQPSLEEDSPDTVTVPRKFRDAKEERNPVTFYVSDEAEQNLRELRHHLENEFPNEEVRKLDVYAAVVLDGLDGFAGPEKKLREWGYGKEIR